MASIKGISLKSLKTGIGHDRVGFQANIYLNNKKIGEVLDDGYGGCLDIYIQKQKEEFELAAKEFFNNHNEDGLYSDPKECLLYKLVNLTQTEKYFKQVCKKGYEGILELDFHPRNEDGTYNFNKPVPYPSEKTYYIRTVKGASKIIEEEKPVRHKIYSKLEDFLIA